MDLNACLPSLTTLTGKRQKDRTHKCLHRVGDCVLGAPANTFLHVLHRKLRLTDRRRAQPQDVSGVSGKGCHKRRLRIGRRTVLVQQGGAKSNQVLLNGFILQRHDTKLRCDREMQNPFKRSIAIKFKSESYVVLSLSFFIVILVKKKKKKQQSSWKKTVTLSEPCCTRNLSICIWIMNTL